MEIINPDVMENLESLEMEVSATGNPNTCPGIGIPGICPMHGGGGCTAANPAQDCKRRLL